MEFLDEEEGVIARHAGEVKILRENQGDQDGQGEEHFSRRERGSAGAGFRRWFEPVGVLPVPMADFRQHDDSRQGGQGEPKDLDPSAGHDDERGQQRTEGGARIAADLKQGLRKTVPSARGHARHPRGFRMKNRRAHSDQGRGHENHGEVARQSQQHQAGERKAHPHGQGIGFRIPVRIEPDQRLQEGSGQLVGQGDQADLGKAEVKGRFQERVDRRQQRLHRVVEQVRKAEREKNRQDRADAAPWGSQTANSLPRPAAAGSLGTLACDKAKASVPYDKVG